MTYCLNPKCPAPATPKGDNFCVHCGSRLRLGDRYMAFQPIGGGVSSRTFLATDSRKLTNNRCVIKEFEQQHDGEAFRYQLASIEPLFQHPQFPSVFAYFERDDYHYLVQEFINGHTLSHELQNVGAFPEDKIWYVLREVLILLQFIHDSRIIHRDIKPTNLIRRNGRSDEGSLMLVDFGAAKVATQSALARTGTVIGSAEYIAPEQLLGQVSFASDLYSLGATCLHLVTGLSPFELFNHLDGTWLWRSVSGPISDGLADILDKLVAKNLSDRYTSAAAALSDVMNCWEDAPPLPAQPRSSLPETEPPPQRWHCQDSYIRSQPITTLTILSNGDWLAGQQDGAIARWTMNQPEPTATFEIHKQAIAALAVSPDGQQVVSSSYDKSLKLWNLDTGDIEHTLLDYAELVTAIAFLPSGEFITAGRDKTIRLWAEHQERYSFEGHHAPVESLAVSSSASIMVSGDADGIVRVWSLKQRESWRQLAKHNGSVSAIALIPSSNPDEPEQQTVVSASWDMNIRLRHLNTGGLHQSLSGHLLPIKAIALSPDAQTMATGSQDSTIKLWNVATGQLITTLTEHTAPVNAIAFLSSEQLISAAQDRSLRCWQVH